MPREEIEALKKRVKAIEWRNSKVELDKAWEISLTRRVVLSLITYLIIAAVIWSFDLPQPLINALIPALALLLAAPTLRMIRSFWERFSGKNL
ncbi:MAG: hypothetical protein Q8O95_02530 [bacterium]|nr:hypothetical protein [bacterium]